MLWAQQSTFPMTIVPTKYLHLKVNKYKLRNYVKTKSGPQKKQNKEDIGKLGPLKNLYMKFLKIANS